MLYFDILIFAVIAGALGMRLYKALGRRTNGLTRPQKESAASNSSIIETTTQDPSSVFPGMDNFMQKYPTFDSNHFLSGARSAFKIIVKAFSEGDIKTLRPLLSEEVYKNFGTVIEERKKRAEVCFSRFVGEINTSIIESVVQEKEYKITVEFKTKQINTTHDKEGNLIEGNPDIAFDSLDIWSFNKEIGSTDENWYLVETKEGDF